MEFSMELPNVAKIAEEVAQETKPLTEEEQALQAQAKSNALAIIAIDTGSLDQRREMLKPIENFGQAAIHRSAQKNQLLEVPLGALSKSGDEGSAVSKSLADLRREVKDLDPSLVNFAKKGRLGKVVNPVRNYFDRYQKADVVIGDIIASLDKGGVQLKNDNTTLELEQHALRELTKRLTAEIAMGTYMDEELERLIEEAEAKGEDPERVRFVREEVLFPLRQRLLDMQQMVAVNQQG
ncbi:MAG: toxic anion resistance protein, partial [Firmicutes bacterium]|nr:toxic anion resistance protein [Bacillota bacterium]